MTVKLVLLKSGEQLISDIKEGFHEEKMVCYLLEKPCTISVNGNYKIIDDVNENGANKMSISLHAWPSFSNQNIVEIFPEWIVTFVESSDELKKIYKTEVLGLKENKDDQNTSIAEQSDLSLTD